MFGVQTGLSGQPQCMKMYTHFLTFKQPKQCIKLVALMLLLPTPFAEEKTLVRTDSIRVVHWRPQIIPENVDSVIKTHHNQQRRQRGDRKISTGKGSLGHWHLLQSKWTLIELETDMAAVMWCPLSFEFLMSCTLHFPNLKINTKE